MKTAIKLSIVAIVLFLLIQCSIKALCQSVNAGVGVSIPYQQTYGRLVINSIYKDVGVYIVAYTDLDWKIPEYAKDTFFVRRTCVIGTSYKIWRKLIVNVGIGQYKSLRHINNTMWDSREKKFVLETGFTWELLNKNRFILGVNSGYLFVPSLDIIKVYSGLSIGIKIK